MTGPVKTSGQPVNNREVVKSSESMAHLTEMSPLKQESFKAEANTPGASDDPQAFLLAK